jgi:hypothetical protein
MSNYSSKNVLFSSDKEYFYIEKYGIMNKKLISTGAFGIIAIVLGAFALKKVTTTRTTNYF